MKRGSPINDPITDEERRLATILGRENTGKILAILKREPYRSASDIAHMLHIHVATAQKYLREMKDCGLLGVRMRTTSTRPTEEFYVRKSRISIAIDLGEKRPVPGLERTAAMTFVRETENTKVAYGTDGMNKSVTEILLIDEKERKMIGERIPLEDVEGKFIWHVPFHTEEPKSVLEVLEEAEIPKSSLPKVLDLVERLSSLGKGSTILEKTRGRVTNERSRPDG